MALARALGFGRRKKADEPLLSLRGFGIAYGERQIVDAIDLDVPPGRVVVLMGPAGTGKSSLLRALCTDPAEPMRLTGEARFRGRPLAEGNRPVMVAQQLQDFLSNVHDYLAGGLANRSELRRDEQRRQFTQALERAGLSHLVPALDDRLEDLTPLDRRCLSLIRILAGDPPLVCLDEPTARVDEASQLLAIIKEESARRAFLVITHHQGHAQEIADDVVLFAGGHVVEQSPAVTFFSNPRTDTAAHFLKTGSCDMPSPDAKPEHLSPERRPQAEIKLSKPVRHSGEGPPGFRWLIDGKLGGTRQPGIYGEVEQDLQALNRVGATVLVSLTKQPLDAAGQIRRAGLQHYWLPIEDMGVPDMSAAVEMCAAMEREIESGGAVIYHCLAGHGRTGLMLVAHLIYRGMTAGEALEHARQRKREWVQSMQQEQFLWDLELHLAMQKGERPGTVENS